MRQADGVRGSATTSSPLAAHAYSTSAPASIGFDLPGKIWLVAQVSHREHDLAGINPPGWPQNVAPTRPRCQTIRWVTDRAAIPRAIHESVHPGSPSGQSGNAAAKSGPDLLVDPDRLCSPSRPVWAARIRDQP